jgi:hypothetical protein
VTPVYQVSREEAEARPFLAVGRPAEGLCAFSVVSAGRPTAGKDMRYVLPAVRYIRGGITAQSRVNQNGSGCHLYFARRSTFMRR